MRDWTLGPSDPLALTLAADFRLSSTDYVNDQIWELETGGGDPPALALQTTFGLRARAMRLFPRFTIGNKMVTDPATFTEPVRLHRFYPNFLHLDFSPLPDIDVNAEYWVPDSHATAGRFTVTNLSHKKLPLLLELCGQLAPLDGQRLSTLLIQSVNVLAGSTSGLAPVIFLTGGPQPGPGPYPSLSLELVLEAGAARSLTWVMAALSDPSASFELARRIAARPWDAERARIEMVNAAQTVEVQTGDPDWDAALAFSQKNAFSLFFGPSQTLPNPSFVISRQPDQGYSARGDGKDYSPLWNGQPPLEAYYLAGLLPGAPELAAGLIRNFLAVQSKEGSVDWRPGLVGQRGTWLAAPLLASLVWRTYQRTLDQNFLHEIQPGLDAFIRCWFTKEHDRDLDGFPEWDHPMQTGLEDNPAFTVWQTGGQGAGISAAENPALSAMLFHEIHSMGCIAEILNNPQEHERLELKSAELRSLTEECWDASSVLYHNRDRVSHRSPAGKSLAKQRGIGTVAVRQTFKQSVRLLVRLNLKSEATRRPVIILHGQDGETLLSEHLERMDFQWGPGQAVATSRELYTRLDEVEISGLDERDQVSIQIMDFSCEDISLFLPIWAGIPAVQHVQALLNRTLLAADRFGRPFGIPACASAPPAGKKSKPDLAMSSTCQAVHLPWNVLIGEGLLAYGLRQEAANLTARLMTAVIQNLKKQHAFYRAYHAETGAGIGERNAIQGLAPLGFFLDVLGVEIQSSKRLRLSGKNPFPWPVTVKYRGLTVTRQSEKTEIIFPDGQTFSLNDPTDAVVFVD
jgi:hypothetical protein